jgi:hypothetical protein
MRRLGSWVDEGYQMPLELWIIPLATRYYGKRAEIKIEARFSTSRADKSGICNSNLKDQDLVLMM